MKNCLDIGIIQAFLDGELSSTEVTRVSDHIGACDPCAMLLAQAEDENAVVFPALAREFDTLVPTQRLWTRIEDSIQVEKDSAPWWQKATSAIAGLLTPQIGAFAALVLVVGIFALVKLNGPAPASEVAINAPSKATPTVVNVDTVQPQVVDSDISARPTAPTVEKAAYRTPRKVTMQSPATPSIGSQSAAQNASYVAGEDSYVNTIASLTKTVGGDQDPNVMRASERVSYERDMAVVNSTIERMRAAVKKNPRNETAKNMLAAAYQNKIDLLNSVVQKEELVASLR